MTDLPDDTADDPWLTLAEIADELRLSPVTIRSWIAKGRLRAMRAGQRKWLVRRSDLDAMLADTDGGNSSQPTPEADTDTYPDDVLREMIATAFGYEQADREQTLAMAAYEWDVALDQSRMAPPDARFTSRIRHIAQAASWRAAAIRDAIGQPDFVWTPAAGSNGMTLSYELRPGGNRPGPKEDWDRVDRVVARLGEALEGPSAGPVADVFSDLARALNDVADGIEKRGPRPTEARDGSTPDGEEQRP
jgi:excisionase family DNA binding protein